MADVLYRDNDHVIRARALSTIDATGTLVYLTETATVALTVTDTAGVPLEGEVWPVPLTYVTGSQGDFQGVIRNDVVLPAAGETVLARVVVDNGDDQHGVLTGRLLVQERPW